jgi:hypothetical protein
MVRSLILEREQQKQRANDLQGETLRQTKRAEELYLQNLRLQLELERYKKWYYGPRADRLSSGQDLAQALLEFGEQLQAKAVHPEDVRHCLRLRWKPTSRSDRDVPSRGWPGIRGDGLRGHDSTESAGRRLPRRISPMDGTRSLSAH